MPRPSLPCLAVWFVLVLVANATPTSTAVAGVGAPSQEQQRHRDIMLKHCHQIEDLFGALATNLSPWKDSGISRSLMAQSINKFTTRNGNKGIALAFRNGTAFVVEGSLSGPLGHHASAMFAYMQVMLDLQRMFGNLIPDVEFVIATSDRPMVLHNKADTGPPLPVFRFCTSSAHADIPIPIFHFTTKKYTQEMLQVIPQINKQYPWESKKEILFGRFAHYMRFIDPSEPSLQRTGANNSEICAFDTKDTAVCKVRQHLIAWSKDYLAVIDVKSAPRLAMLKHAQYKYLLHMDGQALSSRMDLLMPLNSLVLKEESGYYSFYYHLLKPKVHFLPVWEHGPEDILTAIQWAKAHDKEARKIASNAQQFALKYLDKRARTCYWFRLLVEFSKLLRYEVSPKHEVQEAEQARQRKLRRSTKQQRTPAALRSPQERAKIDPFATMPAGALGSLGQWKTVEEYMRVVPRHYEGGRWRTNKTEAY